MDRGVNHFFNSIRLRQSQESLIHELLQAELPQIIARRCNGQISNECLLADIGDFLATVLDVLSELAQVAVHGNYIREYSNNRRSSLEQEPDLHTADYLDDKHEGLRQVTSKLRNTSTYVKNIWENTPPVPVPVPRFHSGAATPQEYTADPSKSYMASRHSTVSEGCGRESGTVEYQQPESSEHNYGQNEDSPGMDEESPEVPFIEQLRARGKGVYKCPHKENCRKGGVLPDGTIRIFSRNSEFRAHLLRHEKMFKCDLPGCPNNGKGFARSDQLDRHKQNVKHSY
ncbi:hypothetical protein B0O99DRAFT_691441 [Bisporella sp. PMI_857]|nr:hypothetical protein B0O99DRAFT_691441 [Bisporella sp. PMI_857]